MTDRNIPSNFMSECSRLFAEHCKTLKPTAAPSEFELFAAGYEAAKRLQSPRLTVERPNDRCINCGGTRYMCVACAGVNTHETGLSIDRQRVRNAIGGTPVEDSGPTFIDDNLAVALCTYFSNHPQCPDEPDSDEHGWKPWIVQKCNTALDAITDAAIKAAQPPRLQQETNLRPCTCHPDDDPPRPCPQKFALSECRAAAGMCRKHGKHSPGICPKCDELAEARMIVSTVALPPAKAAAPRTGLLECPVAGCVIQSPHVHK